MSKSNLKKHNLKRQHEHNNKNHVLNTNIKIIRQEFNITVNNILRALMGKKDRKYVEQMDSVNWETELLRKN